MPTDNEPSVTTSDSADTSPDIRPVLWGRVGAVLAILAGVLVLCWPRPDGTSLGHATATPATQPSAAAQLEQSDVMALAHSEAKAALRYVKKHGTFAGFAPDRATPVMWSWTATTAVFARTTSHPPHRCVTYNIVNGHPGTVLEDPTLLSCTENMMASRVAALHDPYD